jgi:hypothetical protein
MDCLSEEMVPFSEDRANGAGVTPEILVNTCEVEIVFQLGIELDGLNGAFFHGLRRAIDTSTQTSCQIRSETFSIGTLPIRGDLALPGFQPWLLDRVKRP